MDMVLTGFYPFEHGWGGVNRFGGTSAFQGMSLGLSREAVRYYKGRHPGAAHLDTTAQNLGGLQSNCSARRSWRRSRSKPTM
jgi:hypothetical protein